MDKIVSYGELLSSQIISARMATVGWKMHGRIRRIDQYRFAFGYATVDFDATNQKMNAFSWLLSLCLLSRIYCIRYQGATTTLEGIDYTAAIYASAVRAKWWKYGPTFRG
jgi:hypothetical protein